MRHRHKIYIAISARTANILYTNKIARKQKFYDYVKQKVFKEEGKKQCSAKTEIWPDSCDGFCSLWFSLFKISRYASMKSNQRRIETVRGPRLFDHTDWNSKKRSTRPQMSCFPLKISVESKKSSARLRCPIKQ